MNICTKNFVVVFFKLKCQTTIMAELLSATDRQLCLSIVYLSIYLRSIGQCYQEQMASYDLNAAMLNHHLSVMMTVLSALTVMLISTMISLW
jgi:hypothetical protein